jgi:hypothetical protein
MAGQLEDGPISMGSTRVIPGSLRRPSTRSHLYSLEEGGVSGLPRAEWFRILESRPSAKSKGLPPTERIVSIDVLGPEARCIRGTSRTTWRC